MLKKGLWVGLVIAVLCTLMLSGCEHKNTDQIVRIGTIAGPDTQIMEAARDYAKERLGLQVDIIEFSDYTMPNIALNDGNIDANMFQHKPYLEETIKERRFDLVPVGKTFIFPMGVYSQKWRALNDLPKNAVIAIPNDPSNGARALLLLQKAGVLKLKNGGSTKSTVLDIVASPKEVIVKEIDAAQLPRTLPDVDLAVINTNYAIPVGLVPTVDALFTESADSQYANIVVVRGKEKKLEKFKLLMEALHSPIVERKAEKVFSGQAIPAWKK